MDLEPYVKDHFRIISESKLECTDVDFVESIDIYPIQNLMTNNLLGLLPSLLLLLRLQFLNTLHTYLTEYFIYPNFRDKDLGL